MSMIVQNGIVVTGSALAANKSAIIDCQDIDVLSLQIVSTAQSGSNIVALYESVDGTNFVAVSGATVTITTSAVNIIWHLDPVFSRYLKVLFTAGSGATTFVVSMNARNNTVLTNGVTVPITLGTA
jgi:hypothetical protein